MEMNPQLVAKAKAGDKDAFAQMYEHIYKDLFLFFLYLEVAHSWSSFSKYFLKKEKQSITAICKLLSVHRLQRDILF